MQADRPGSAEGAAEGAAARKYQSSWHCFRTIVRTDGYRALMDGVMPRVAKIGVGQAVIFSTYTRLYRLFDEWTS